MSLIRFLQILNISKVSKVFNEHKKMGLNYDKNKVKIINNTPDPEILFDISLFYLNIK